MKVVAALPFIDKYTGAFYKAGQRLDVTEERGAELLAGGFVKTEAGEQPAKKTGKQRGAKQHDGRKQTKPAET